MSQTNITTVLVAGGYGAVGSQVSKILAETVPGVRIIVGGRNAEKAQALADQIPGAGVHVFDLTNEGDPLDGLDAPVSAVLMAVNDIDNAMMTATIKRAIPYIDITRWTDRVRSDLIHATLSQLNAPVVFSSSWMASVPALIAAHEAAEFMAVTSVEVDIMFGLADLAGPNSTEYVDRLATPFSVLQAGVWQDVIGLSDPKQSRFFSGARGTSYRMDTPDHLTLPSITGAATVATRITYDDQPTMDLMAKLVASGVWSKLQADEFDDFRTSLLYNPGEGAPHEVTVTISGTFADGREGSRQIFIHDGISQTHLTALGAVIQAVHTLGLDGATPRAAGVYFGERHRNPSKAIAFLKEQGVELRVEDAVQRDAVAAA